MDSSGGLVTEGGAAECQEDESCFNHIINAHVQKGWHVTGIWRSSEAHKCLKVRGNGRTIPFQFSGMDASQKKALCLSQHVCEKCLLHSKLVTAYKGAQRVTIEKSQRSRERARSTKEKSELPMRERYNKRAVKHCWCETYCSRTHQSDQGSPARHHTGN